MTLLLVLETLAPRMKAYDKPLTGLTAMSRALSSGSSTTGNTVDPTISMPGTLLSAGFSACREPLPLRLSFRCPALPPHDWILLQKAIDSCLPGARVDVNSHRDAHRHSPGVPQPTLDPQLLAVPCYRQPLVAPSPTGPPTVTEILGLG